MVKSGDTLSEIAARHKLTVSKLCELNGIKSTAILSIGKSLRVNWYEKSFIIILFSYFNYLLLWL